ncbi:MAG: hypothetical protein J7518_20485 [Nocardioidaceae bacterium]|nr:hypothetical protein [Nocardioidaceae bacterium]
MTTTLLGAVASATAAVPRLYQLGKVPASPTYPYGVYSAVLGGGGYYTLDSETKQRYGVVTLQAFGKTTDSATDLLEDALGALLDKQLTFDDYKPTTPLRAALDQPSINRDPNDTGVIATTMPLTFLANKETA